MHQVPEGRQGHPRLSNSYKSSQTRLFGGGFFHARILPLPFPTRWRPHAARQIRRVPWSATREGWHRWADMRSISRVAGRDGQICGLRSRRIARIGPIANTSFCKTPGQSVARESASKHAFRSRPHIARFQPAVGKIDRTSRDFSQQLAKSTVFRVLSATPQFARSLSLAAIRSFSYVLSILDSELSP